LDGIEYTSVDGRNPAPVEKWFIPIIIFNNYRASTIQGDAGFLPSTVSHHNFKTFGYLESRI